jgi:oxygen-independent coproporphyrinogen-3 oxidase
MKTGIYIHVPFCRSKCAYCSFVSIPWDELLAERYRRAVIRELEACAQISGRTHTVDTIYFGGGTPSLLPLGHVAAILDACRGIFNVEPECEISLEANPGTLAAEKLLIYHDLGVTRISLGAQSFSDEELTAIGRIHTASQIGESTKLLRDCGFQNLNLDLILGLPGQTEPHWASSLECAVALAPAHLSIYMLELDSKVPLCRSVTAGHCQVPDEDSVADGYLYAINFLEDRGYFQYEISNFSRPGCECRHNLKYWRREPVLAFGVAAHSHDGASRYANVSNLSDYLSAVEEGRSPRAWRESLDSTRELEETIFLGLRLNRGLDWDQLRRTYEADLLEACEASLKEMAEMGLLRWSDSMVRLTHRGMLLSNEVFQMFVHPRNTCEE